MEQKIPAEVSEYMRRIGRAGGKQAAAKMTPAQRSERARKAVAQREQRKAEAAEPAA